MPKRMAFAPGPSATGPCEQAGCFEEQGGFHQMSGTMNISAERGWVMPFRIAMCALLGWSFVVSGGRLPAAAPDLILHHGRILTVDREFQIAEAIAIAGEEIVTVGSNEEVLKSAGPETRKIDLGGKAVLPGLIDSHVHAAGAAIYEFDHPVPEMETIADVLQYIARRAEQLDDGQWILIQQVFITRLRDQRFPTRAEMDKVAPRNPVMFRTGPDAAVNSLALELSGIDEEFKLPPEQSGQIERDPVTGKLNGIIRGVTHYIKMKNPEKTPKADERREQLRKLLADYNSVGITSITERGGGLETLKLYQDLKARDELTCRVFLCRDVNPTVPWEQVEKQVLDAANDPAHEHNDWIWLRGVKVYLDGGMLTGSAYLREPWGLSKVYSITDPGYRGVLKIPPERVYELAKLCLANDLQVTAHSVGDGAVHTLIDAYRRVNDNDFSIQGKRPGITHCNFMSEEAVREMARLGIVADLQPVWIQQDGKTLRDHFGAERLTWFQPYRAIFERGTVVGGGSDHMQKIGSLRSVNPYNPFLGIWSTLTRLPRWSEEALHLEQIITREQALRLYTINNAYLSFEEDRKGSLEPGKLADLIVIDRDYLNCSLDDLRQIQVEQTYVGGKLVYSRP